VQNRPVRRTPKEFCLEPLSGPLNRDRCGNSSFSTSGNGARFGGVRYPAASRAHRSLHRALSDLAVAACLAVVRSTMGNPFRYFNSSPEVIRLVVMMYVRYPLSLRNVEDVLAEHGIDISHETVRFCGTGLARCSPPRSARDESHTCASILSGGGIWVRPS
jgi:hypothetical protein